MGRNSYPGEGDLVWNGLTVRPDGCQVVTTHGEHGSGRTNVFTTAIFPPNTGRQIKIVGHNTARFEFEFKPGLERTPALLITTCRSMFTAGRQHEQAVNMSLPTDSTRSTAWERLLQEDP